MCRILSVVDGRDVPSETVLGVTSLVGSAEMAGGEVVVLSEGEVWRGEEVVEAVLGKPAGVAALVVEGNLASVMAFVVSVSAVVIVVETVVLSVTTESVVEVVVGVTVDISMVSLIGDLLVGIGSSMVLMVHAALGDLSCVVVKRESVGLVEEVNQKRAVMAKGALLVLDVMGLEELVVLVTVVSGASVTLTVDNGSRLSGLTIEGVVGSDGGPGALEGSGVSEGVVGREVGSSGAGETSTEGVCVLIVPNVEVGPVYGEVIDVVVVLMGLVVGLDVVVAFVTGEDGVKGSTVTGAFIPVTILCVL